MSDRSRRKRRIELDSLIDLEVQLQQDRELDPATLRQRDGAIGQIIGAKQLESPDLFLAWLEEVQSGSDQARDRSPGKRTRQFLEILGLLLALLGLALGAAAVASWLAYDTKRPVNIIYFWATLIGVQIVLLMGWCIAVLPAAWLQRLPGFAALQTLLRAIGRIPAGTLAWIGTRISSDYRETITQVQSDFKRLDWLYGNLKLWLVVRLTQIFAIAYNVGAIVAFVALSYGNDPSFGWRSTMLSDAGMHGITSAISIPWAQGWPEAVPTQEQIKFTKDYSLEKRNVVLTPDQLVKDIRMRASWWPFLLASLLVYGLAPRIVTWLIASFQLRSAIRSAKFDHYDFRQLAGRLRRPLVTSQAAVPEPADDSDDSAAKRAVDRHPIGTLAGAALPVMKWAGVNIDVARIDELLRSRFGASVARLDVVGKLDPRCDEEAIAGLDRHANEVVLIVEAWEPPVADYLDFVLRLRAVLGDGRMINVLLYHRTSDGVAVAPVASDLEIWRGRLGELGDPWLAVEPMIESTAGATKEGG